MKTSTLDPWDAKNHFCKEKCGVSNGGLGMSNSNAYTSCYNGCLS